MPLYDLEQNVSKNRQNLALLKRLTFLLGINITTPSTFKDSLRIFSAILLVGNFVSIYGQICFIVRFRHNIPVIAEAIMLTLQTVISDFKLVYLMFYQRRFYEILHQIESQDLVNKIGYLSGDTTAYNKGLRKELGKILNDCWGNARKQFIFYTVSCVAISGYYCVNSQVYNFYNWYIGNQNFTVILAHPTYFPQWQGRMRQLSYYVPLTFAGISASLLAGVGAISFDGMFIFIALHCVALVRVLKKLVVHTTAKDVPKSLRLHILKQCIDHHERTYQLCTHFNQLYFHISLLQLLLSLVILGVVMFQASVGIERDLVIAIRMVMYMSAAGYEVVIYCFNGQLITNEYDDLSYAWFDCEWYNESWEFKQLIQMMITRSNRGFTMHASWFSKLSMTTFMALAKTSGSYFLLLRKFND